MNISPHHQRPTRYPWPGLASRAALVVALAVVVIIGFVLIANPFASDNEASDPTAVRVTDTVGI